MMLNLLLLLGLCKHKSASSPIQFHDVSLIVCIAYRPSSVYIIGAGPAGGSFVSCCNDTMSYVQAVSIPNDHRKRIRIFILLCAVIAAVKLTQLGVPVVMVERRPSATATTRDQILVMRDNAVAFYEVRL